MRYHEHEPAIDLRGLVECFWSLELDPGAGAQPQRIFPDGRVELVFHFGVPFERSLDNAGFERQPRWLVVGQMTRATQLRATGATRALGVRLRPATAGRVLAPPLEELRDSIVPLASAGLRRPVPSAALEDARDTPTCIAVLEHWLRGCLAVSEPLPDALLHAVATTMRAPGSVSLDTLLAQSGLSARQLERAFARHVGLPPKLFARIVRFQSVFAAASGARPALAGLALDCGYADQPHFTRDFREFSGTTPGSYFGSERGLAGLFTRAR